MKRSKLNTHGLSKKKTITVNNFNLFPDSSSSAECQDPEEEGCHQDGDDEGSGSGSGLDEDFSGSGLDLEYSGSGSGSGCDDGSGSGSGSGCEETSGSGFEITDVQDYKLQQDEDSKPDESSLESGKNPNLPAGAAFSDFLLNIGQPRPLFGFFIAKLFTTKILQTNIQ